MFIVFYYDNLEFLEVSGTRRLCTQSLAYFYVSLPGTYQKDLGAGQEIWESALEAQSLRVDQEYPGKLMCALSPAWVQGVKQAQNLPMSQILHWNTAEVTCWGWGR